MKKSSLLILLLGITPAIIAGCSIEGDQDEPLMSLLSSISGDPGPAPIVDTFYGPASVSATDAVFLDKVGVNWATVDGTVSYKIYRSESLTGPFGDPIGIVNAADLPDASNSNTSTDFGTIYNSAATTDTPIMQATYQSNVDLNELTQIKVGNVVVDEYRGICVFPFNTHNILITIGDSFSCEAIFFGGTGPVGHVFTADEILSIFSIALNGKATCSLVSSGDARYLKIVSGARIVLENNNPICVKYPGSLTNPPLMLFLDSAARCKTVITVEPVPIDMTPPVVNSVIPANGAVNVPIDTSIKASFSEAMDTATINTTNFTLTTAGIPVAGTVSRYAVFKPLSYLSAETEYTATITTGVADQAGNHLAENYTWTFTTAAATETIYYFIDENVTPGKHYYYMVIAVDADGNDSTPSPVNEGFARVNTNVPGKIASCTATDGTLADKVAVTWSAAPGATYYKVYRISGTTTVLAADNITGTSYDDTTVTPGLFAYKVAPYNASGEGGDSDMDAGYRAITDQEFFVEAYKSVEEALMRMENIGTQNAETIYDKDGDGTCIYSPKVNILSGKITVTITFTNFCDLYLTLDGQQKFISDFSQNGSIKDCQLDVSGIYNGYVKFDIMITGGVPSGGNYIVSQNGGITETLIPYNYPVP